MRLTKTLTVLVAAIAALAVAPSFAGAQDFAPADQASIHPGVQTFTEGGQCTANFVLSSGDDLYIGQAAHCSGTGAATDTNGCDAGSLPLGTEVEIDGASRPGELVYSSWLAMQAVGETDHETCDYNDFGLIKIDPADHGSVNPSLPSFGGPEGIGGTGTGEQVYTYGNSSLRLGISQLSPKNGITLQSTPGGWSHTVYTVTPGVPGDSGSAVLNADGSALGTLSTVAIAPLPASNGVSDFGKELAYAQANGFPDLVLEDGTEPFTPKLLGLIG